AVALAGLALVGLGELTGQVEEGTGFILVDEVVAAGIDPREDRGVNLLETLAEGGRCRGVEASGLGTLQTSGRASHAATGEHGGRQGRGEQDRPGAGLAHGSTPSVSK